MSRPQAVRTKLPEERQAITHKFDIQGHEGYITVGLYDDGTPGELFLVMAKEGSTISGFADAFAQAISYCLQYGVPLSVLVEKFIHTRFEPSGMTRNSHVRFAKSIVDYVFRWLDARFPTAKEGSTIPNFTGAFAQAGVSEINAPEPVVTEQPTNQDAPPCSNCGNVMVSTESGSKCVTCEPVGRQPLKI